MKIVYCPTELMIADLFMKPLQGGLFKRLKEVIMGHIEVEEFKARMSITPKERVGTNKEYETDGADRQSRKMNENVIGPEKSTVNFTKNNDTYASIVKKNIRGAERRSMNE